VRLLFGALAVLLVSPAAVAQTENDQNQYGPWPVPENIESGMLQVSDLHTIQYMTGGNPDGIPVFMLHGGPGAGGHKGYFTYADPEKYFIIVHDQRGSGKSTPFASVEENTTWDLMDDINKLRTHLNIEKPAVLWGVSWGSTLALAYAQEFPDAVAGMVLVSSFTGLKWEIDHIYHGGLSANWPENFDWMIELVDDPLGNVPAQYFEMITGEDEELATEAATRISAYELKMVMTNMSHEQAVKMAAQPFARSFAKISTYYMMNHCFLIEGQLLRNAHIIADIPTYIISGRADPVTPPKASWELHKLLDNSVFYVAPGALHNDEAVFRLARRSMSELTEQLTR
jgi:proline iminopeptidase